MTDRRCPYCNELVPSNSITCPACYRKIPRDIERTGGNRKEGSTNGRSAGERRTGERTADGEDVQGRTKSRKVAMLLAGIPGVFGLMGLGQMYIGNVKKGLVFLCLGVTMMLAMALIVSSFGDISMMWAVLAVGALILIGIPYVLLYLFQLMDATASSALRSIFPSFP